MIALFKRWWRPTEFVVSYVNYFGVGCDNHDKSYDNIKDAEKRIDYLASLDEEALLKEGLRFVPNYFRIIQLTSGTPLRRLLNKCGSKRMYKVFGYWV